MKRQESQVLDIPLIIGGKEIRTGKTTPIVKPHDHKHVLANFHMTTKKEVHMAIEAAMEAKKSGKNVVG